MLFKLALSHFDIIDPKTICNENRELVIWIKTPTLEALEEYLYVNQWNMKLNGSPEEFADELMDFDEVDVVINEYGCVVKDIVTIRPYKECINNAIAIALQSGQTDGEHHKLYVIDQMLRYLAGDNYEELIKNYCNGEDGPNTYSWETGTCP